MLSSEIQTRKDYASKTNLDGEKLQKGVAKLVLVIVELLRQILERQAVRRIQSGSLSEEEVERLGLAFMLIKEKVGHISEEFGLQKNELDGALRSMLKSTDSRLAGTSLVDVVDRLLSKGAVIGGRITVSVADIDLIALDLLATLSAITEKNNEGENQYG
ncbi:MAG TPA: gas vesicle protein K [Candidatus Nitrosotalea sp.]|nr:gas vesicle protein K [Candidatus Nitrosotalea sp.]